ncbi:MAG TPA: rhodanese-like domain-containing protein [Burkholderiales bacterium]|nr:rhodanese-like domain-containing protein [Burkholderiales bacterium]
MSNFAAIDPLRLHDMKTNADIVLVDVRTDLEVSRGVIPGALHIPLHLLPARFEEIDRSRPVVFYCQSGARSAQASAFLNSKGWPEVYNLAGGINAWIGNGMPVAAPG